MVFYVFYDLFLRVVIILLSTGLNKSPFSTYFSCRELLYGLSVFFCVFCLFYVLNSEFDVIFKDLKKHLINHFSPMFHFYTP